MLYKIKKDLEISFYNDYTLFFDNYEVYGFSCKLFLNVEFLSTKSLLSDLQFTIRSVTYTMYNPIVILYYASI